MTVTDGTPNRSGSGETGSARAMKRKSAALSGCGIIATTETATMIGTATMTSGTMTVTGIGIATTGDDAR